MSETVKSIGWFYKILRWLSALRGLGDMDARLKATEKDNTELLERLARRGNEIAELRKEIGDLRRLTNNKPPPQDALKASFEKEGKSVNIIGAVVRVLGPGQRASVYCASCWLHGNLTAFTDVYESEPGNIMAVCSKCQSCYPWPIGTPIPPEYAKTSRRRTIPT